MRYYRGIRFDLLDEYKAKIKNKVDYSRKEIEDAKLAMRDATELANQLGSPDLRRLLKEAGEKASQVRLLLIQAQNYVR